MHSPHFNQDDAARKIDQVDWIEQRLGPQMKGSRHTMAALLIALELGAFSGCSPQKRLAHRLKGADRVVFASNLQGDEDRTMTVTGEEVNKIVEAIANARKVDPNVDCTPASRLEFFNSSEHLLTITNCVSVFWIAAAPFEDTSETLETLEQRRREEYIFRRAKSLNAPPGSSNSPAQPKSAK